MNPPQLKPEDLLRKKKKDEDADRIIQRRFETLARSKNEKIISFNKLKKDLLTQVGNTPYRNSPSFEFKEPLPGCHYDIGPSFGYVVIPYLKLIGLMKVK